MNGNIVLIGVGGTGMSGVAGMLQSIGFENIVGLDSVKSELTQRLSNQGIKIIIGDGKYIPKKNDLIIYSQACQDSLEVKTAFDYKHNGKDFVFVMSYFEFLGEVSKYFKTIGISGTNGKSTTTTMLMSILKDNQNLGLGIVGALSKDLGMKNYFVKNNNDVKLIFDSIFSKKEIQNYELIKKYYFVLEACEYKRHFLNLDLDFLLITNINLDHTDYYKNERDYFSAFETLIGLVRKNVFVLKNEKTIKKLKNLYEKKLIECDLRNFEYNYVFGEVLDRDASLVYGFMEFVFDMSLEEFSKLIQKYRGLWRRMEYLGTGKMGAIFYSDYGHVAESIGLAYQSLKKKFTKKKLCIVFQPHQMQRVIREYENMVNELKKYDKCFLYDIYCARESMDILKKFERADLENVEDLGNFFAKQVCGEYFVDFEKLYKNLESFGDDWIVLIMTAGDLDYKIRNKIL